MKVLHITTSSKGGAGIAALRLHEALCKNEVVSGFLSANLTIDFKNELVDDFFFKYKKPSVVKKIQSKFKKYLFSSERQKSIQYFDAIKGKLQFEVATLPFSNFRIHDHPLVQEADIIHLHWVGDLLDYPSFFNHCQKPIVWTLHDQNPFQGLFHYKNDELQNAGIIASFDNKMKQIKATSVQQIKRGAIISPSKWLLAEAKASDFFSSFLKECIPNAIDLDVFKPQDTTALRKENGLKEDDFIILFVADKVNNYRKGFDLFKEALSHFEKTPITIVVIGKIEMPILDYLNMKFLGKINAQDTMAKWYSLADVILLPSREDNLPNVILEAFACGTPLIGFAVGGIAEHIKPNHTGILADEISGLSLAKAIQLFYETKDNYKSESIRKYAETNFSLKKQAEAYRKVYDQILDNESL
jgi:glycosyltransferase involved in cell wall biosynthesis